MKILVLASLLYAVLAFEDCGYGIHSPLDEVVKVSELDFEQKQEGEFEVKFKGTALTEAREMRAHLEASMLGIKLYEYEYIYCHDARPRNQHSWLRTSLDESPKCSIKRGEEVSGTLPFRFSESLISSMDVKISLTLKASEKQTCVNDVIFIEPQIKTDSFFLKNKRFQFSDDEIDILWSKWLLEHQENVYLPPEAEYSPKILHQSSRVSARKAIFGENLMKIIIHNSNEKHGYKMAMNHFGHLTESEFKKYFASGMRQELSLREREQQSLVKKKVEPNYRIPAEVNWVKEGAVTEVKNQGACGSCWSFAATGSLEGAYFLSTGNLVSFSEQELVSCDHVDLGCNGGAMDNAWKFAELNRGLCAETGYPYTSGEGVRGFCDMTCTPVEGSVPKNIVDVQHDEQSLKEAVAKQPIAVAIEADEAAFQFYSTGVLTSQCSQKLDHGVLVVGYGTDPDQNVDYWLVKNSWGPMWGLNGYIKLERGIEAEDGGECGILLGPSYPEL